MNYSFKTKPFAHQLTALENSWDKEEYALLMEMGTGKSKVLIDNMAMLFDKGRIDGALIIAPKGVYRNWDRQEIPVHMPEHVDLVSVPWKPNPRKAEKAALENILFPAVGKLRVLVMNVEAFSTKKGVDFATRFLSTGKMFMAIDESTTVKNASAKRTKSIVKLRQLARYRRIATGSPITQSPLDLYAQFYFLDKNILGFQGYHSFKQRFAVTIKRSNGAHFYDQIIGYQNLDELTQSIKPYSYRALKEHCLDLPEKIYTKREVTLTKEQEDAYKEMKAYAMTVLETGEEVSVTQVITQLLRLQQIACGFVKTDDDEIVEIKSNRIEELKNVIDETSGKVIIWATWRYDIQRIERELAKAYGPESVKTFYGDTPADERQDIVEEFQDPDSKLRFFVGNPTTAGYGLTLTQAHTVVYYSNNYNLEVRLQSEDRAHRIGQKNNVTYVDLYVPGTVDEMIFKALIEKKSLADEVLEEKWRQWLK